jgi:hypothetical protein
MMASLSATWLSVKCGSPFVRAPHEHHRRAGRGGQQDQPGDVAVDLVGRQVGREQPADEDPASSAIENGLTAQLMKSVTPMPRQCCAPGQRGEVDLQQHRDDHQPDQQGDRQVDLGDFHAAPMAWNRAGKELAERDADDDAHKATQRVR